MRHHKSHLVSTLITMFMGLTWGPSGDNRTQGVGVGCGGCGGWGWGGGGVGWGGWGGGGGGGGGMLAPWTLLFGYAETIPCNSITFIFHCDQRAKASHFTGCLFKSLSRLKTKIQSKFCITAFLAGNPPVFGGLHTNNASNTENVSMSWRHRILKRKETQHPTDKY